MSTLRLSPWPHLIVDDFLPRTILDKALFEIEDDSYQFDIEARGSGRIEYSVLKSRTLWRAIYSIETVCMLSRAFGVDVVLNKHNMLQLRRMNDATPEFPKHNDFTAAGDQIASFLYLSPNWSFRHGGRLRLFASLEDTVPATTIGPVRNRFVAFKTSPNHWHSVERVFDWERLSVLSLWDTGADDKAQQVPLKN